MNGKPTVTLFLGDLSAQAVGRWVGGVRSLTIADALSRRGEDVQILGFNPVPALRDRVEAVPADTWSEYLGQCARRARGDLLFACKLRPASYLAAVAARRMRRRPLLLDLDDDEPGLFPPHPPQPTHRRWRNWVRTLGGRRSAPPTIDRSPERIARLWAQLRAWRRGSAGPTGITAASSALASSHDAIHIPSARDADLFDPARHHEAPARGEADARYREVCARPDRKVVLYPGAARPYKGIEDLIVAVHELERAGLRTTAVGVTVVLAGGSPYDDYTQRLHQLASEHRVELLALPPRPHHEMPGVVGCADLVAVPQRDEPVTRAQFPLKLLDAMAMAKPVLATDVGDIPEIVGGAVELARPGDPTDLARVLSDLVRHPEQATAMGGRLRRRFLANYTLDHLAERLGPVLDEAQRAHAP